MVTELSKMQVTKEFAFLQQHFNITTKITHEGISELI